ncbi:MAG: hypothetical protein WDO73_13520 [Ignavibacteriota bacterium]
MIISVRDVGQAKIVEVAGEVDLSTSKELRKTLFATLPLTSVWRSTWGRSAISIAPASRP